MSSDVYCANPACREPWDALSFNDALRFDEGDMTQEEALLFRDGKGCPSCKFGFPDIHISGSIQRAKALPKFPFRRTGTAEQREAASLASIEFIQNLMEETDDPDQFLDLLF